MEPVAWDVLLAAGTVFFLGAVSPGPSLMVVLRNTMIGGRRQGVMCALGHGLGFGLYAGMAVFGLIVLLEEAPTVFTGLQLIGCILLVWYGWSMWNANHEALFNEDLGSSAQGFAEGFLISFLNPKILVFLVAIFSQFIDPEMDYFDKLNSCGFRVRKINFTSKLSKEEIQKYCLNYGELIPFVQKPNKS